MNELIVHISKANKKNVENIDSHNILDNKKQYLNILDYWILDYYDGTHVKYSHKKTNNNTIYIDNQYKHVNDKNFTEVLDNLIQEYDKYNNEKLNFAENQINEFKKEKKKPVFTEKLIRNYEKEIKNQYNTNIKNKNYNLIVEKIKIENPNSKIFMIGDLHSSLHSFLDFLKNIRDYFEVGKIIEKSTGKYELKSFKLKKDVYIYFF